MLYFRGKNEFMGKIMDLIYVFFFFIQHRKLLILFTSNVKKIGDILFRKVGNTVNVYKLDTLCLVEDQEKYRFFVRKDFSK